MRSRSMACRTADCTAFVPISRAPGPPAMAPTRKGAAMPDSCATCAYSREMTDQPTYERATAKVVKRSFRTCHAHPPQVVVGAGLAVWPAVGDDDWCAEFSAIPQPAPP